MPDPNKSSDRTHKNDNSDAINDATPQTMIVAYVSFEPVPPRDAPSGISRIKDAGAQKSLIRLKLNFS